MAKRKRIDPKIIEAVKKRSYGLCELCGRMGEQYHHIFGGNGRRKPTERVECISHLCAKCHNNLHDKGIGNRYLKLKSQSELASNGYSEDEIRKIVGGKLEI